jgi:peptidoglycan DL-endopeptidase CwlO
VHKVVKQRIAVASAAIVGAGLLLSAAGSAGAAPTPTLSQVEHEVSVTQSKLAALGQQFDSVQQQLTATRQRLQLVRRQLVIYNREFDTMQAEITRIGVTDYEDGNLNASISLLTSGKPQQILDQSSILDELAASNNAEITQFLAAARQLVATQQVELRTESGISQLKASLQRRTNQMNKVLEHEKSLVAELTPAQQAATTGTSGSSGSLGDPHDPIPTSSQAGKAVAFAYSKIGCPYLYGGTGPCSVGYDCSGLTMTSWEAAGIQIPRTSYEQWDDLPHVSLNDLEPGDILVFLDAGHVALYVGNNELIQAPQTGQLVQLDSFTGWFRQNVDGAVRP